jgi:hypothetical protein
MNVYSGDEKLRVQLEFSFCFSKFGQTLQVSLVHSGPNIFIYRIPVLPSL